MRLYELETYRNKPEYNEFMNKSKEYHGVVFNGKRSLMQHFLDYLKEKGYVPLGSGAFAAVFTHPNINYAIKIFRNDPSYLKFINYCDKNKGNPHLPKFRGKPMTVDKEHYCIRMELLNKIPPNLSAVRSIDEFDMYLKWYKKPIKDFLKKMKKENPIIFNFFQSQPGLLETLEDIIKLISSKEETLDLHSDNLMMRGKDVVITDPICDGNKIYD